MRLNLIDKFWYSGRERIGLICPLLAFRAMIRTAPSKSLWDDPSRLNSDA
jgi:hypothetical protein